VIVVRFLAFVLIVLGLVAALVTGVALLSPEIVQSFYSYTLPHVQAIARPSVPGTNVEPKVEPGDPIGVIEIPRLGLSSVVLESDETAALLFGVGHLADTPLPWRDGNSVFAAHRDTYFRDLGDIRRNDVIRFRAGDRDLSYRVQETKIVNPTDVEVLAPTKTATLTLITCYPFHYVGPAPRRFIVRAERVPES
jgi:sortase A